MKENAIMLYYSDNYKAPKSSNQSNGQLKRYKDTNFVNNSNVSLLSDAMTVSNYYFVVMWLQRV